MIHACQLLRPVDMQRTFVAEIEAKQALVSANCELIARMKRNTQATLARIWGEEVSSAAGEA